jgi:DNA-binding PadR family transcriptional regulator
VLELAVLGLLKERPMHGYEVKKRLDEKLGHFWQFSYGSLYPSLKRLSTAGHVAMEYPKGEASRRKNVYRITDEGEQVFERLIEESGPTATEGREQFMLRLAFFRYMKPETRRRLLENRRGYLQARLTKITAALKNVRERMDNYSLELMRYGADETEHDIKWLDGMLEAEAKNGGSLTPTQTAES